MRRLRKWLFGIVAIVAILLIFLGGITYLIFSNSVFPDQGEFALSGASADVYVAKDKHGIPNVRAQSRADALRALGYLHASERLWQMETLRMAGQGRLSEVFGKQTVNTDIFLKTLDFATAAQKSVRSMSKDAVDLTQAYVDGINAYIERETSLYEPSLPPEFMILGHRPETWEVWHSVIILKIMALTLDHNLKAEIGRLALASKGFSPEEIDQIYIYNDRDTPVPLPDLRKLYGYSEKGRELAKLPSSQREFAESGFELSFEINVNASNSWAISGKHTDTGLPLMANDPHLAFTTPSTFYLAHLNFPMDDQDFNLVGGSLPGTPLFLVGRNDQVAWGLTTTRLDGQDLYIEQLKRGDNTQYRTKDGYEEFETKEVSVKVKGDKDVSFKRRVSRHGPVLPNEYLSLRDRLPFRTVGALKSISMAHDDTTLEAALELSTSRDVFDLIEKTQKVVSPMQSVLAADVKGNIGLIAAGRAPVRSEENLVKGRAPVPGWEEKYEWIGYLDHSELPKIVNPESGVLVTANSHWLPKDYKHHITYDWSEDFRQLRAEALFSTSSQKKFSKVAVSAGMADQYSHALIEFRNVALANKSPDVSSNGLIVQRLREWDGEMRVDAMQPLFLNAWIKHTNQLILADDLGEDIDLVKDVNVQRLTRLIDVPTSRNWCNKQRSPKFENCSFILDEAFELAIDELEDSYGNDWEKWRWGDAHRSRHEHRPFSHVDMLSDQFTNTSEIAGGNYTLLRSKHRLSSDQPYRSVHGAAFRAIYDFSNLENSGFMISGGQSGNIMSDHFDDLLDEWSKIQFIQIRTKQPETDKSKKIIFKAK